MKKIVCLILVVLVLFSGCGKTEVVEDYGSFTMQKSYSSDEQYYVTLTRFMDGDEQVTVLDIRVTADQKIKDSIKVGASENFRGYCWEDGTYNVWVQYADKDPECYVYKDFGWKLKIDAVKPDSIVTK